MRENLTPALLSLARHNIPVEVQELLVLGNPMRDIPSGALAAAIEAAVLAEREACAGIASKCIEQRGVDDWAKGYRSAGAEIASEIKARSRTESKP